MAEIVPIPEPPRMPFIGHLGEFTSEPIKDLTRLADTYGPIYRLHLGKGSNVFVSSQALVNEVCDEKRFKKCVMTVLGQVRNGVHDGLFTAFDEEANWAKAHRILIPAFGPLSIRGMFDEMHDIASQLCMKWARHGPLNPINASEDFTRLALDTLALCAMDYRFNSFYHEEMHPFIAAMGDFLGECGARNRRPAIVPEFMYRAANQKFWNDIKIMRDTADAVVEARKKTPNNRKDLLTAMLAGVDPTDGTKLDDSNITDQLITFLIAGHETTSALLSFGMWNLLKNPVAYQKVQQEVDDVVGREPVRVEHLSKLPYITAVLRETLRVTPSITAITVEAREETLLAGKYFVAKAEPVTLLLSCSQMDPLVFGEDAAEFKPERMLDDNFNRLNEEFPNCWKPFGNGKRACIGRPFAWQEALLCMVLLFQSFTFSLDDPNYQLLTAQTLTVKPKDFYMRAELRHNMTPTELESRIAGKSVPGTPQLEKGLSDLSVTSAGPRKPMAVFYGSNSGTCEALAQRVASNAPNHGFDVTEIAPLDAARGRLPKDRPVVIVTSSYEGQPPANATHFVNWIESLHEKELEGVAYAVFGCGHHDWVRTFHRIPKLVDSTLTELGGEQLAPLGLTDAAERDMFSDFETWEDESLWPALAAKYGTSDNADASGGGLTVEISQPRKTTLRQDVEEALVLSTKTLTGQSDSVKNHIEIQLPTGMSYRAGDYLAVLPINPKQSVSRVFRRFNLSWDAFIKIGSSQPTTLPTGTALPAADVLGAYVELNQPATKKNILTLAEATEEADVVKALESLAGDKYRQEISLKRVSVLDLLEKYPSIELPLATYLAMLPPIRVTLTYSVLERPHLSGSGQHVGVSSNFLSSLNAGERLHVAVRPSAAFHLPSDAEKIPLICVAAGSGLAPFRGFIQERAVMIAAGRKLAPALLFFGCRSPGAEDLYADEFARWESLGAVSVRRAYSRASDQSFGCKYVQDRMLHDSEDIYKLWKEGARLYVCGSEGVSKGVDDACVQIVAETGKRDLGREVSTEEAKKWFEENRNERYMIDVFD
ncbi:Bifunctional P-450:NADPH-P450 reductase [Escovopsis weberi]|uniref:Bifunctional cytochrome P450/NADPH--P450 reductase n=1 Tax=Escovopsis weberi TaxID=150374 RepID=A0A0M9VVW4_ESCWE|nr:Bifunctional P-450:NADPH-P450 reductase [Escovopsis weberi]